MFKVISVDFKADFGFFKKPDINEGIYLTFNMLHKPALLGILGAIAGLEGYKRENELPQYYLLLKDLQTGIQPLNSEKGNFVKTTIKYNNAVGYASQEVGGILNIVEQTLIKPAFRCFMQFEDSNQVHQKIMHYLKHQKAEYLPYLGKNEYSLWWDNYNEHNCHAFNFDRNFKVVTLFIKSKETVKNMLIKFAPPTFSSRAEVPEFMYFEELPVSFNEVLIQYHKEQVIFTNFTFSKEFKLPGLHKLEGQDELIQLF